MYLGNDEIFEMYLGDDSISEAYLGEDLVFSSGSGPTPPTPTGSTRTLEITDIPTPPVPTEPSIYPSTWIQIQDPDNGTVELTIEWNDNDNEYNAVVTTSDWEGDPLTAITATYSNGTLTAEGDWGDNIYIQYAYYDEDINCEVVPDDESFVEETFTGDTISLAFPTLEVNAECQCGKEGGEWDGDNEVCVHPTVRTLSISNIPTPPSPYDGEDPWTKINIDDGENYAEFGIVYDWSNYQYVISTSITNAGSEPITGFTTAFTNSAFTISGDWGDEVNIYYDFVDSYEFGNCLHVGEDSATTTEYFDDGETAVSSITLTFPSLEVDAECQCGKDGGEWDGDNEVCVHPTGLFFRLSSIPDDGNVHTVTVTDADSRECTLSIDMSDHSYTESADADDKYSVHMENDDIANSTAEWMIEGNMYGTYVITVDGAPLLNEPDYDGSGNFVLVEYDYNDDTMTNYCSRDAFDCEIGGGTYDCQTGECSEGV
jgi:hypothetical protein